MASKQRPARSKSARRELSPKQQRFVEEYLVDLNATQAAIRAGYAPNSARQHGARLLTNDDVQRAVAAGRKKLAAKAEVTVERVLQELASVAYSDLGDVIRVDQHGRVVVNSLDDLPPVVRRSIESVKQVTTEVHTQDGSTVEKVQLAVKLHGKVKALELLMNYLGMHSPQKVEVSGEVEVKSAKSTLQEKLNGLRQRVAPQPGGNPGSRPGGSG